LIEKIKETGRRVRDFLLKFLAVAVVFFLGMMASPEGWRFQDFIKERAHDPQWTLPIFYLVASIIFAVMVFFVIKVLFGKKRNSTAGSDPARRG